MIEGRRENKEDRENSYWYKEQREFIVREGRQKNREREGKRFKWLYYSYHTSKYFTKKLSVNEKG